VLLAFGGPASAQTTGIVGTKHNLGSSSTAGNNKVTDTAEVCVFCHTPHGAAQGAPAPLWNKRLGTAGAPAGGGSYTLYTTTTSGSIEGAVAQVGGVSMACLSCHDGTQAMDNIINAPGSGGYDLTGGAGGVANPNDGRAYTWNTGGTVDPTGKLISGVAALGTDLSNDHPIGIQYCGGGLAATGLGTCNDLDFKQPLNAVVNGATVVWIETGGAATGKQRTDLPLYPARTAIGTPSTAQGTTTPMVECATCHDPHVKAGESTGAAQGVQAGETFLRISNASSAVCTACHVK
jgi:hypothetical protein